MASHGNKEVDVQQQRKKIFMKMESEFFMWERNRKLFSENHVQMLDQKFCCKNKNSSYLKQLGSFLRHNALGLTNSLKL